LLDSFASSCTVVRNQWSGVEWLHLEIRPNLAALDALAARAVAQGGIGISIELEKERPGDITKHGDLVMVSRALCDCMGHSYDDFLALMVKEHTKPGAIVVCSLGEKGAIVRRGEMCWSTPSFPPAAVVDTVGAGDTFNAALIRSLVAARQAGIDIAQEHPDIDAVETALREACQVAGAKVGMGGFGGLRGFGVK